MPEMTDRELDLHYAKQWLNFARYRPSMSTYDRNYPECHLRKVETYLQQAGGTLADIGTDEAEITFLDQWGRLGEACKQWLNVERAEDLGITDPDKHARADIAQDECHYRLEQSIKLKAILGINDQQFEDALHIFREHKALTKELPVEIYQHMRVRFEPILMAQKPELVATLAVEAEADISR